MFSQAVCLETLELRPVLPNRDTESLVGFLLIPKHVTFNDLEWSFYVKFCFHAGIS